MFDDSSVRDAGRTRATTLPLNTMDKGPTKGPMMYETPQ